ncbi:MAG: hypothetical protein QG610_1197, partial [Euryarchaeota archaeon]|nr:hypothetical protein [Euryarchaeota archaeon]
KQLLFMLYNINRILEEYQKIGDTETHYLLSKKPNFHVSDYPDIELDYQDIEP